MTLTSVNGRAGADPAHGGPLPQATLPELIGRLINDVSELADKQIELAKQEIGEAKDEAIHAIVRSSIGVGIALAAVVLLVIWAWTAIIWFFNWVGALVVFQTPLGPQYWAWLLAGLVGIVIGVLIGPGVGALVGVPGGAPVGAAIVAVLFAVLGALIGWAAGLGWLLGMLVPCFAAWLAWARFIGPGIARIRAIWPPLPRTRETLKEDLEWVKSLRTPSER